MVLFFICLCANVFGQKKWVDVTCKYISNPNFSKISYDEWEVDGNASSITIRVGCMEMWNGRIDMQKIIKDMPNGHYRFSIQALYRTKNHKDAYKEYKEGKEVINGFIFANDNEKKVASQYSFGFTEDPGVPCFHADGLYFPNSMEAASKAFSQGEYNNNIEFDVTDGTAIIGLYNPETVNDNWFVFDNVKIEQQIEAADITQGSVVINEIMTANVDMFMSPAYNFDGWIELYNTTSTDLWLGGCYISNDLSNPKKWLLPENIGLIPANGHKVIWFGSNSIRNDHSPFKLEGEGGIILLSDANGNIIIRQDYPEAKSRLSWARTTDGNNRWSWTANPTPAQSNNTSVFSSRQLNPPVVDKDGQLFSNTISLNVEIPAGATLRYTTDGTTPTLTNGDTSTNGQFTASNTVTYRFRLFQDGMLPSKVTTRTFIKTDRNFTLPIIAVSTKDEYLYDDQIGVYVKGSNGCTGNGQNTPANWNMDWDRPVNFHYIMPETNTTVVNQDVDFAISGGWTRANSVKSFKLKADRVYDGLNAMEYPFFASKPYLKNKTLQVRGGGNDSYCKIKDAAIQTIMQRSGINLDLISYQPAVHFINGEYKGLINVREPNNKDFAYANFGYSKEELEVYEQSPDSGAYMMVGTKDVLTRLVDLSATAAQPSSYEEIKTLLDIDEYTNYMAALLYLGSWDWPDNNVKAYRKKDGGKYRFVVFDLDAAFGTDDRETDENGKQIYRNTFRWIDGMQWHWYDYIYDEGRRRYGEIKFCTFFLNMLENADFRKKFIDTFCLMGGSVFDTAKAEQILDQLGNRVRPTMSLDGSNPDGSLNEIRNKLNGRMEEMTQDMIDYERLRLSDIEPQYASIVTDTPNARLFINDIEVPYSEFNGNLFAPVKLKATAPAGYIFDGWKKFANTNTTLFAKASDWNYYDKGSLYGSNWFGTNYNDDSWENNTAPLGYGKNSVSTVLDYGTNSNNKRPTYYFRKKVNIDSDNATSFVLNFVADDGFVVYVNGTEAGRYHLPEGIIKYNTFASTADSNPDYGKMVLDPSLFHKGENVIAVEVHNNNANSTDILWDAELTYTNKQIDDGKIYATTPIIDMPTDKSFNLIACFSPMSDNEKNEAGINPVVINEVSGANSIYVNEYFKRDDWVELYNTTDDEIDVEGMYLSNDQNDPLLYQITKGESNASTIIPAHGYLIIWCDKAVSANELHAPFKISMANGNGQISLTAKDQTWKNTLKYVVHNGDETVGRYPDGSNNVYLMNIPTINQTNIYTSYFSQLEQDKTSIDNVSTGNDNKSLNIRYAGNDLVVRSDVAGTVKVMIYSLSGQNLFSGNVNITSGMALIETSQLANGCYIAKATGKNGETVSCKFIVSNR